jgi:hypothetical protein
MTTPPLPDTPCLRVGFDYTTSVNTQLGNRIFLSYSGSAPSGANCITLATDFANAWNTNLAGLVNVDITLTEVDVLDIATHSGASAQVTVSHVGTRAGSVMPVNVCHDIEYGIARRYRGGKPRGYWPFGVQGDLTSPTSWGSSYNAAVGTDFAAFIAALEAVSVGSVGTLQHVVLSYYHGFTNITNSSGRERAVPTYRATALHDVVTSYIPKPIVGSQRRRRTATTP